MFSELSIALSLLGLVAAVYEAWLRYQRDRFMPSDLVAVMLFLILLFTSASLWMDHRDLVRSHTQPRQPAQVVTR